MKAQFDQERAALEKGYDMRRDVLLKIKQATINEEEKLIEQMQSDYDG